MFATAVTGPIPAVADWQSAIICSSGTSLIDHAYATQVPAQTQANGSTASPTTGVGYTYHCAGPRSLSGSRTPEVLAIQFLAGTLATYLLALGLTARSALRRQRRNLSSAEPTAGWRPR